MGKLSLAELVHDGDEESQHNEGSWRKHEEQDIVGLGRQGETKDRASAQQFTTDTQESETKGKA